LEYLDLSSTYKGDIHNARKRNDWLASGQRMHEDRLPSSKRSPEGDEQPRLDAVRAKGDLAGARKLQEQVLEARERLLGKEHPYTLAAMNNLAKTLKAEKDSARIVQAADTPSSQPSTKGRTGRFRMISNFWELFPMFRNVPKQENPIKIGEIRTKSSRWFIPELTRVREPPSYLILALCRRRGTHARASG
jgi:hypothetical protein